MIFACLLLDNKPSSTRTDHSQLLKQTLAVLSTTNIPFLCVKSIHNKLQREGPPPLSTIMRHLTQSIEEEKKTLEGDTLLQASFLEIIEKTFFKIIDDKSNLPTNKKAFTTNEIEDYAHKISEFIKNNKHDLIKQCMFHDIPNHLPRIIELLSTHILATEDTGTIEIKLIIKESMTKNKSQKLFCPKKREEEKFDALEILSKLVWSNTFKQKLKMVPEIAKIKDQKNLHILIDRGIKRIKNQKENNLSEIKKSVHQKEEEEKKLTTSRK